MKQDEIVKAINILSAKISCVEAELEYVTKLFASSLSPNDDFRKKITKNIEGAFETYRNCIDDLANGVKDGKK